GDGDSLWPRITSTTDNCLGRECPLYEQCWVVAARREALQADVVIINHHLLFADLTLREQGFGELLPDADAVILDEAHKLPDIAGHFFGQTLSGRRIVDFTRDARLELESLGGDMPALAETLEQLVSAEQGFANALARNPQRTSRAWLELADAVCTQARDHLADRLQAVHDGLEPLAERSDPMTALLRRAAELVDTLERVSSNDADNVSWIEPRGQSGWVWHNTPLDVSEPFARAIEAFPGAWVFTSATLAVDNSLRYFCARMGLGDVARHVLPSPFDYENNARLYVPARMPLPRSDAYANAVAEQALALIRAAGGGAFLLCTSYRALNHHARMLRAAGLEPLVQG